jgi:hypothetical protein
MTQEEWLKEDSLESGDVRFRSVKSAELLLVRRELLLCAL